MKLELNISLQTKIAKAHNTCHIVSFQSTNYRLGEIHSSIGESIMQHIFSIYAR